MEIVLVKHVSACPLSTPLTLWAVVTSAHGPLMVACRSPCYHPSREPWEGAALQDVAMHLTFLSLMS